MTPTMKLSLTKTDKDRFADYVARLRYIPDNANFEEVRAPHIVIENNGGDCDDVAVLCAIWARLHGRKYRWIMWGIGNEIYHISTDIEGVGHIDPFGQIKFRALYSENYHK